MRYQAGRGFPWADSSARINEIEDVRAAQLYNPVRYVTQLRAYDWGNLSTPARTYSYTYLADANYTSRRIYNRLVSTQVSGGGQTLTLAYNTHDRTYLTERSNLRNHDTANYGPYFRWRGNLISTIGGPRPLYFWHDITGTPTVISEWSGGRDPLTVTTTPQTNYAAPSALSAGNSPPTRTATVNGRWERTTYDGLGRPIKTGLGAGSTLYSILERHDAACACPPLGRLWRGRHPAGRGRRMRRRTGNVTWMRTRPVTSTSSMTRRTGWCGR